MITKGDIVCPLSNAESECVLLIQPYLVIGDNGDSAILSTISDIYPQGTFNSIEDSLENSLFLECFEADKGYLVKVTTEFEELI